MYAGPVLPLHQPGPSSGLAYDNMYQYEYESTPLPPPVPAPTQPMFADPAFSADPRTHPHFYSTQDTSSIYLPYGQSRPSSQAVSRSSLPYLYQDSSAAPYRPYSHDGHHPQSRTVSAGTNPFQHYSAASTSSSALVPVSSSSASFAAANANNSALSLTAKYAIYAPPPNAYASSDASSSPDVTKESQMLYYPSSAGSRSVSNPNTITHVSSNTGPGPSSRAIPPTSHQPRSVKDTSQSDLKHKIAHQKASEAHHHSHARPALAVRNPDTQTPSSSSSSTPDVPQDVDQLPAYTPLPTPVEQESMRLSRASSVYLGIATPEVEVEMPEPHPTGPSEPAVLAGATSNASMAIQERSRKKGKLSKSQEAGFTSNGYPVEKKHHVKEEIVLLPPADVNASMQTSDASLQTQVPTQPLMTSTLPPLSRPPPISASAQAQAQAQARAQAQLSAATPQPSSSALKLPPSRPYMSQLGLGHPSASKRSERPAATPLQPGSSEPTSTSAPSSATRPPPKASQLSSGLAGPPQQSPLSVPPPSSTALPVGGMATGAGVGMVGVPHASNPNGFAGLGPSVMAPGMGLRQPSRKATVGLDCIDELDETDPLGTKFHNEGPYEAIRRAVRGGGGGMAGVGAGTQRQQKPPIDLNRTRFDVKPGQIFPSIFPSATSAPSRPGPVHQNSQGSTSSGSTGGGSLESGMSAGSATSMTSAGSSGSGFVNTHMRVPGAVMDPGMFHQYPPAELYPSANGGAPKGREKNSDHGHVQRRERRPERTPNLNPNDTSTPGFPEPTGPARPALYDANEGYMNTDGVRVGAGYEAEPARMYPPVEPARPYPDLRGKRERRSVARVPPPMVIGEGGEGVSVGIGEEMRGSPASSGSSSDSGSGSGSYGRGHGRSVSAPVHEMATPPPLFAGQAPPQQQPSPLTARHSPPAFTPAPVEHIQAFASGAPPRPDIHLPPPSVRSGQTAPSLATTTGMPRVPRYLPKKLVMPAPLQPSIAVNAIHIPQNPPVVGYTPSVGTSVTGVSVPVIPPGHEHLLGQGVRREARHRLGNGFLGGTAASDPGHGGGWDEYEEGGRDGREVETELGHGSGQGMSAGVVIPPQAKIPPLLAPTLSASAGVVPRAQDIPISSGRNLLRKPVKDPTKIKSTSKEKGEGGAPSPKEKSRGEKEKDISSKTSQDRKPSKSSKSSNAPKPVLVGEALPGLLPGQVPSSNASAAIWAGRVVVPEVGKVRFEEATAARGVVGGGKVAKEGRKKLSKVRR